MYFDEVFAVEWKPDAFNGIEDVLLSTLKQMIHFKWWNIAQNNSI